MTSRLTMRLLIVLAFSALPGVSKSEDWPQWRGPNRDGVWSETGVVERFASDRIEIRWRAPLGPGYCGPTVAHGRVFVTDRGVNPQQVERVHCFDAKSGMKLWSVAYPCEYTISYTAGPRASVTIDDNQAFALGAMGHLHCLDAGTGAVLWKRDLNKEYSIEESGRLPIWGISAAPLVHGRLLILHIGGKDGACVVALDKKNGEEVWRSLNDRAQYSAPILTDQAGRKVLVVWTGDSVAGLNPDDGQVFWRQPFVPSRMPIGVPTPVVNEQRVFVSSFYDGSLLLRLKQDSPAVEVLWRKAGADEQHTDALHCMISTPVMDGAHIYGVDSYGELRCLDASNGNRVWEDQTATPRNRWSNIHIVRNADRYFMFNESGDLIIAKLSPQGFQPISRAHLIDPTTEQLRRRDGVTWSHPAYADRHVFARSDKEIVCASLEAK